MAVLDSIAKLRLIPVVAIQSADDAEPLAEALEAGGLPGAEITLRTEAGMEALRRLAGRPGFTLGVGTVHTAEEADAAVQAGATYVVTPGFSRRAVSWCVNHAIPVFPGCASPSDLELALEYGLSTVKFFPAETVGGVNALKAFAGPYGGMRYIPTGGIDSGNVNDYLRLDSVVACGGSWMVKSGWLKDRQFDEVERSTKEAVNLVSRC